MKIMFINQKFCKKWKALMNFQNNFSLNLKNVISIIKWNYNLFNYPVPTSVKHKILEKYKLDNFTFIESGTYIGETSKFMSNFASKIITIEPSSYYYQVARDNLKDYEKIQIVNASSQTSLAGILSNLSGNLMFWLDGHFSGGNTFEQSEPPIKEEMDTIAKLKDRFKEVVILVDDFRLFSYKYLNKSEYPEKDFLINWANENGFRWTIEMDIFIAQKIK